MAYLIDVPVRSGYRRLDPPFPWMTERPSTAKPDETLRTWGEVPVDISPGGRYELTAPEGTASWTPARPEDTAAWMASKQAEKSAQEESANRRAMAQARSESLAADEAARARRFQGYDIQRLLSTAGTASKQPGGGLQWAIMAPALAQLMGQAGGTGQPASGFQPTISIDAQGRPSLRLAPPSSLRPAPIANEEYKRVLALTGDPEKARAAASQAAGEVASGQSLGRTTGPAGQAQVELAGKQAAARQGPQIPLTPSEATQAGVPMGTTRGGIAGTIPTTPQERKSITELDVSQNMLDHIGGLADQLIIADDAASAAMQGIKLTAGAALRSNTAAAVFDDQRRALLGIFSRQIGAERGVLTDRDIERIDSALPKFRDTRAIKDQKMTFLRSMISTNRDARIRAIDSLLGTRSPIAGGSRGATRKYDRSGNVIGGN